MVFQNPLLTGLTWMSYVTSLFLITGGGYNVNGHPTIRQSTMKSSPSKVLIREVHQHCKQHGFS